MTSLAQAIARAEAEAPFLRRLIARRPELVTLLTERGVDPALAEAALKSAVTDASSEQ